MIGIFGGSGFYSLIEGAQTVEKETPFGMPSSPITLGMVGDKEIAFIARHGLQHEFPPHKIPYKANIYAFKELGVRRIIAPTTVGSLKSHIEPGQFVLPDQFVNFTRREDTFYEERPVTHVSMAEPFCPELRKLIIETSKGMDFHVHEEATAVVTNGPRFATKAESSFYRHQGWDIVNMTMYPEAALARELEMCYVNVSIVTDYDSGMHDAAVKPVSFTDVARVFGENNQKLKKLLFEVIPKIPEVRTCICRNALEGSRI